MNIYRLIALGIAAVSAAAMLYVGFYQSRFVVRLICPVFGCEGVADAPFARPFGIPDGYIGAVLYAVIAVLLFVPGGRWVWFTLLALPSLAALANIVGVRDMMNLGSFCFYCFRGGRLAGYITGEVEWTSEQGRAFLDYYARG